MPFLRPADSLTPGANLAQEARCPGGREPAHLQPDLGDDHVGRGGSDARDLIEAFHRIIERGDLLLDSGIQGGDVGAERVDPGQHSPEQEGVVVGEVTDERLLQLADLAAHPAPGHLSQHLGVTLAGDHRLHHVPAGNPEDVGGDDRQLDQGVLQELLDPVLLPVRSLTSAAR